MTTVGRRVTTLATLLAVAAAAIAVYYYTARAPERASLAAGSQIRAGAIDDLHSALLPESQQPAGTRFQETTIAAATATFMASTDVVVSPVTCLGALQVALGKDAQVAGWMQIGTRSGASFVSSVGRVAGGLNMSRLRDAVGTCTSGTITWKSVGVTAKISLTAIAAPALSGAQTFAYRSTIAFTGVTSEQLAATAGAACPVEPTPQTVPVSCTSSLGAPATRSDVTMVQYYAYAAAGDLMVESCERSPALTTQMLTAVYGRLSSAQG